MSEDKFEQEEPKDEDVEAHRRKFKGNDEQGKDDKPKENELLSDDFELHKKHFKADGSVDDDSDDVEAHRKLTR
jgi:hypothetical protein